MQVSDRDPRKEVPKGWYPGSLDRGGREGPETPGRVDRLEFRGLDVLLISRPRAVAPSSLVPLGLEGEGGGGVTGHRTLLGGSGGRF